MGKSKERRVCGWANRCKIIGLAAMLALGLMADPAIAQSHDVVVFAAASLKNALDDINLQYQRETGKRANIDLAASSTLAKQIENGAPADIFISADRAWMKYLEKRGLLKVATQKDLLSNELVLVAPADGAVPVKIEPHFALDKLLAGGKLVMADTSSVPAGKYGKAALEKLGVWSSVSGQIAQAENVRAALELVARKEAPYGIVYVTDAAAEPRVKVVGVFPEDTHAPIVYPIAIVAASSNPDAAAFVAYLESPVAKPLFERQGFIVLP